MNYFPIEKKKSYLIDRRWSRLQRDSTIKETEEVDMVSLQPAYLWCTYLHVSDWALKKIAPKAFFYVPEVWYSDVQML